MIQNILKINYYDNYEDSLLNQDKLKSCLVVDSSPNFIFVLKVSEFTITNIVLRNLTTNSDVATFTSFDVLTYKNNDVFFSAGYGTNLLVKGNIYQYVVTHNFRQYYSNPFKKSCEIFSKKSKIIYSECCEFDDLPYSLMQPFLKPFEIVFDDTQYKATFELDKEYTNKELSNDTINITMRKFFKLNRGLLTENVIDGLKSCAFFNNKKFILKGKEYEIKDIDVKEVIEPNTKGLFNTEIDIYTKSIISDNNCCDISLCENFKYVFKLNPNEISSLDLITINLEPTTTGTFYVLYTDESFSSVANSIVGLFKLIVTSVLGNLVFNYQIIPIGSNDFIKVTDSRIGGNPVTYYKKISNQYIQYNYVVTTPLNSLFGLVYCFQDCYIAVTDLSDNSVVNLIPENGVIDLRDYFDSGTYKITLNMKNKSCDYGITTPFTITFN